MSGPISLTARGKVDAIAARAGRGDKVAFAP